MPAYQYMSSWPVKTAAMLHTELPVTMGSALLHPRRLLPTAMAGEPTGKKKIAHVERHV